MTSPNALQPTNLLTTGDARRILLETILQVRDKQIENARAEVICKCVDSICKITQVEINAAKIAAQLEGKAHNFGRVVQMGRRVLGNDPGATD